MKLAGPNWLGRKKNSWWPPRFGKNTSVTPVWRHARGGGNTSATSATRQPTPNSKIQDTRHQDALGNHKQRFDDHPAPSSTNNKHYTQASESIRISTNPCRRTRTHSKLPSLQRQLFLQLFNHNCRTTSFVHLSVSNSTHTAISHNSSFASSKQSRLARRLASVLVLEVASTLDCIFRLFRIGPCCCQTHTLAATVLVAASVL